MLDILSIS